MKRRNMKQGLIGMLALVLGIMVLSPLALAAPIKPHIAITLNGEIASGYNAYLSIEATQPTNWTGAVALTESTPGTGTYSNETEISGTQYLYLLSGSTLVYSGEWDLTQSLALYGQRKDSALYYKAPSTKVSATSSFAGGDGTRANPYQIATAQQLARIGSQSSGGLHFILTADIDLSGYIWEPIEGFSGVLDGDGYSIRGLYASGINAGLFATASSQSIAINLRGNPFDAPNYSYRSGVFNLNITDSLVSASKAGGAMVGFASDYFQLYNCSSTATVLTTAEDSGIGGLVGNMDNGLVGNCANYGLVKSLASSNSNAGGIVGFLNGNSSIVVNCLNSGKIHGTTRGAIVGSNGGKVQSSYFLSQDSLKLVGTGSGTLTGGSSFISYAFDKNIYWRSVGSDSATILPELSFRWNGGSSSQLGPAVGDKTPLYTAEDLASLSAGSNGDYLLVGDMDLGGKALTIPTFSGTLDGKNLNIGSYKNNDAPNRILSGLTAPLIGTLSGKLKNISVDGSTAATATLATTASNGSLLDGVVLHKVAGPLVGTLSGGTIQNSAYASGTASKGLATTISSGTIQNSASYGVPLAGGNSGTIQNCVTDASEIASGNGVVQYSYYKTGTAGLVGKNYAYTAKMTGADNKMLQVAPQFVGESTGTWYLYRANSNALGKAPTTNGLIFASNYALPTATYNLTHSTASGQLLKYYDMGTGTWIAVKDKADLPDLYSSVKIRDMLNVWTSMTTGGNSRDNFVTFKKWYAGYNSEKPTEYCKGYPQFLRPVYSIEQISNNSAYSLQIYSNGTPKAVAKGATSFHEPWFNYSPSSHQLEGYDISANVAKNAKTGYRLPGETRFDFDDSSISEAHDDYHKYWGVLTGSAIVKQPNGSYGRVDNYQRSGTYQYAKNGSYNHIFFTANTSSPNYLTNNNTTNSLFDDAVVVFNGEPIPYKYYLDFSNDFDRGNSYDIYIDTENKASPENPKVNSAERYRYTMEYNSSFNNTASSSSAVYKPYNYSCKDIEYNTIAGSSNTHYLYVFQKGSNTLILSRPIQVCAGNNNKYDSGYNYKPQPEKNSTVGQSDFFLTNVHIETATSTSAANNWSQHVAGDFAGGNGDAATPYLIATAAQLARVETMTRTNEAYRSKSYRLTADIDMRAYFWSAICSSQGTPFKGSFDGNGFTISGLHGSTVSGAPALFGYANGASIKNLRIENSFFFKKGSSTTPVGQVASLLENGLATIQNCYSSATLRSDYAAHIGGLVGNSDTASKIQNSVFAGKLAGSLTASSLKGPLSAAASASSVEHSYWIATYDGVSGGTRSTAGSNSSAYDGATGVLSSAVTLPGDSATTTGAKLDLALNKWVRLENQKLLPAFVPPPGTTPAAPTVPGHMQWLWSSAAPLAFNRDFYTVAVQTNTPGKLNDFRGDYCFIFKGDSLPFKVSRTGEDTLLTTAPPTTSTATISNYVMANDKLSATMGISVPTGNVLLTLQTAPVTDEVTVSVMRNGLPMTGQKVYLNSSANAASNPASAPSGGKAYPLKETGSSGSYSLNGVDRRDYYVYVVENGKTTYVSDKLTVAKGSNTKAITLYGQLQGSEYYRAAPTTKWENNTSIVAINYAGITSITTAGQLAYVAQQINVHNNDDFVTASFRLENDIDLGAHAWTPIGTLFQGQTRAFEGSFDGNGFTISNIYVNETTADAGLFGPTAASSEIKNLMLRNACFVSDSGNAGALAGHNLGTVANCSSGASVVTKTGAAGGIVGNNASKDNNAGKVSNCYSIGEVNRFPGGSGSVGGVIGSNSAGSAYNYYLAGSAAKGIGNGSDTSGQVNVFALTGGVHQISSSLPGDGLSGGALPAGTPLATALNAWVVLENGKRPLLSAPFYFQSNGAVSPTLNRTYSPISVVDNNDGEENATANMKFCFENDMPTLFLTPGSDAWKLPATGDGITVTAGGSAFTSFIYTPKTTDNAAYPYDSATLRFTAVPSGAVEITLTSVANTFSVTYSGDAGIEVPEKDEDIMANRPHQVSAFVPQKSGFEFAGWIVCNADGTDSSTVVLPGGSFAMPARHVILKASWKAATGTKFVTEHYQMAVDGTYPAVPEKTIELAGKTGDSIGVLSLVISDLELAGKLGTIFDPTATKITDSAGATTVIAADGSTVVKLYYKRLQYNLTIEQYYQDENGLYQKTTPSGLGGSISPNSGMVYYDSTIQAVPNGYSFRGYFSELPANVDDNSKRVDANPNTKMPAAHTTYFAIFDATYSNLSLDVAGGNAVATPYFYNVYSNILLPTPTRANFVFTGWQISASNNEANWKVGDSIPADSLAIGRGKAGNASLVAQWIPDREGLQDGGYTSDSWATEDVTFRYQGSVHSCEYQIDDGPWLPLSEPLTISQDTTGTRYSFRTKTQDGALVGTVLSYIVKLDKTQPGFTAAPVVDQAAWTPGPKNITFTAEDGGSGLSAWAITKTPAAPTAEQWTSSAPQANQTVSISQEGEYYIWIQDSAGNVSVSGAVSGGIDTTAPSASLHAFYGSDEEEGSAKLYGGGTDSGSGLVDWAFSNDGINAPTDWSSDEAAKEKLVSGEEVWYFWVRDAAGNSAVSTPVSTYLVNYHVNDGSGNFLSSVKIQGQELSLRGSDSFVRAGLSLDHWNENEDDSGLIYPCSDTYAGNAPLTLYAQWLINPPQLSVSDDLSTDSWANEDVVFTLPPLPETMMHQYSSDGGLTWVDLPEGTLTISEETSGNTLDFRVLFGEKTSSSVRFTVLLDKTAPRIDSVSINSTEVLASKTVTIEANDTAGPIVSGVTGYALSTSDSQAPANWNSSNQVQIFSNNIYYAWVQDGAGNSFCDGNPIEANIDATPPAVSLNARHGGITDPNNALLSGEAVDEDQNIVSYLFTTNPSGDLADLSGENWMLVEGTPSMSLSVEREITAADAGKIWYFWAMDESGKAGRCSVGIEVYTISYYSNLVGQDAPIEVIKLASQRRSIAEGNLFQEAGKEFRIWSNAPDGNGRTYNPGSSYLSNGNLSLYAQWSVVGIPAAPGHMEVSFVGKTATITSIPGAEYSMDGGHSWQSSNQFTGLDPATAYEFAVRYAQTDVRPPSRITTLTKVTAPSATSFYVNHPVAVSATGSISGITNQYEYSMDGSTWIVGTGADIMDIPHGTNVYIRLLGDGTLPTSEALTILVERQSPPIDGGGGGGGGGIIDEDEEEELPPNIDQMPVIVQKPSKEESQNNQTTVSVNQKTMEKVIHAAAEKATLVIPVANSSNSDSVVTELVVKNLADMAAKGMTLEIQSGNTSYQIPTAAVDTSALKESFGADVDWSKVPLEITIANSNAAQNAAIHAVADKQGFSLVLPAVEFTISASYGEKTVSLDSFSAYVPREMELTEEQAKSITTAIVYVADGRIRHVPTFVYQKDGKWFVRINSRSNSTYVLIHSETRFADASGKWYEEAVNEMGSRKIINGITPTHFAGERQITRAEFAVILVRALGLPPQGEARFSDVPVDSWCAGAVAAAADNGIVSGKKDGSFAPNAPITRQEAMVMLYRASKLTGFAGGMDDLERFADRNQIAGFAKEALSWSVGSGIVMGNKGNLLPQSQISRAETATIVLRLIQKAELVDTRTQV